MMKVLVGLLVIVAVGVGGWYAIQNGMVPMGGGDAAGTMEEGSEMPDNGMVGGDAMGHAGGETSTGNWGELMAMGAVQCEVGHTTDGVASSGTVYVSGGNLRGDFTSTSGGTTIDSHIIANSDVVYTWSSAMPGKGIKMQPTADGAASGGSQSFDTNQEVNYSCSPWTVDASKFNLPSGVEFMDVAAMMQMGAGAR